MGYRVGTSIIPQDIQRSLFEPGKLQQEFLEFLQEGGYNIDQSKSIAAVNYYGQRTVGAGSPTRLEFFNQRQAGAGKFVQNTPDVRPESEHALVWAVEILTQGALATALVPGWDQGSFGNGLLTFEVNNVVYLEEYGINDLSFYEGENTGVIFLPEPIIWPGQTSMKAVIETDTGLTEDSIVQVNAFGLGLV